LSARCLWAGRWASSIRPSRSRMTAQTTGMGVAADRMGRKSAFAGWVATFRGGLGFQGMKSFLKIVLLVLVALLALKLLPLTLALGCLLALAIVPLAVVGVSAIVILCGVALVVVAVLAPVWIPVLALVGLIALIKRCTRRPVTA